MSENELKGQIAARLTLARKSMPEQIESLKELFQARCESYNKERPERFPLFQFVPPDRVDAGKFAIVLATFEDAEAYGLSVCVGVHPNAAQFMTEVPKVDSRFLRFGADHDENGFFWRDLGDGERRSDTSIVTKSFIVLCDLLIDDAPAA